MFKVALTGGIATGKSYVLAKLRARGIPTIDADEVVHEALGPGTPTTQAIARQFGADFLRPDGSVDRALLAAKVFGDAESRLQLEALIHPVVYDTVRKWYGTLGAPMGVASVPLMYETHRERDFDFVAVTVCSPEQQMQRVLARDSISEEEARQRMAAQMPAAEKARRADFAILTGGTTLATDQQVDELLAVIRNFRT